MRDAVSSYNSECDSVPTSKRMIRGRFYSDEQVVISVINVSFAVVLAITVLVVVQLRQERPKQLGLESSEVEDRASMARFNEQILGPMDLPEGVSIDLPDDVPFVSDTALAETPDECDNVDDASGDSLKEEADPLAVDAPGRKEFQEDQSPAANQFAAVDNPYLKAAGAATVAVALATTLTTVPIDEDMVKLPEPTPIVQVYTPPMPDQPPAVPDDDDADKASLKQKILKMLKYALIALAVIGSCLFGALQGGCTACSGMLGAPLSDSSVLETSQAA